MELGTTILELEGKVEGKREATVPGPKRDRPGRDNIKDWTGFIVYTPLFNVTKTV